ncbi:MAG: DUF4166 domain-containing protein [Thiotrichaceae bacterium]|jgi:hypothetical protein|uniref:DUF4166 domain-containing protein n=1 Tax=Candidatus Thiocaldithrix dubininis TaxID=3080823 RepID=A0AA95KDP8_9GAMM|nr:MAG: DUF4166 domain-containing protein [Candidatus Thiocaldithrix dubininis]
MKENSVTRWFGDAFKQLHPSLQHLHREGGRLQGIAEIKLGENLVARWLGKRLAYKLGIPVQANTCDFGVEITYTPDLLLWGRRFGEQKVMSTFKPVGHYPHGYWVERTGAINLQLGVNIIDGGWHWQQQRIRLFGLTLPLGLMPRTTAYKTFANNKYVFNVVITLPFFGNLLSYSGELDALPL